MRQREGHAWNQASRFSNPEGTQLFHNFVRPHVGLKGKTPAEVAGIIVENKWLTIIQNAVHVPGFKARNAFFINEKYVTKEQAGRFVQSVASKWKQVVMCITPERIVSYDYSKC